MTVLTKDIVSTMAYLTGVKREFWLNMYGEETTKKMENLDNNDAARTIRYLSKLRTALSQNFLNTDNAIRFEMKSVTNMDWFNAEDIKWLQKKGISVVLVNKRARDYYVHWNELICRNISSCKNLFPDWVEWEYIKELFIFPKYNNEAKSRQEYEKYKGHINDYPCQVYINWEPRECGYLFGSDMKFLKILYDMHEKKFNDASKVTDASEDTKENIYDFINRANKVDLVVDCENSDAYKLYAMIKNLEPEELEKIHKIILYDDVNTRCCWDFLERHTSIPVEHVEVERVVGHKSLVDVRLTTGICREHYQENVDSFILLSSDSDYWALIQSMPEINFLVVVEWEKCSPAIKEALSSEGIYYCYLDDFSTGSIDEFKRTVLLSKLREYIPNDILGKNGRELAKEIFYLCGIEKADSSEINNFYEKYIKTLKLTFDSEGNFTIVTA